ncbi:MAG: hypothetical protein Q6J33_06360 [Gloeomargarita sp. DG_2_bins_126]
MKPRPRLTPDNNPLKRPPSDTQAPGLTPSAPSTEWVSYQIPPELRQQLQHLQQQWQTHMPELTESQLVALALRCFLEQSRRNPPRFPPADAAADLMDFLD